MTFYVFSLFCALTLPLRKYSCMKSIWERRLNSQTVWYCLARMDFVFLTLYRRMFSFSLNSSECAEDLIERRKEKENFYHIVYAEKKECSISLTTPIVVLMTEQIGNKSENLPRIWIEVIRIPTDNSCRKIQRRTNSNKTDKMKLLKTFVASLWK